MFVFREPEGLDPITRLAWHLGRFDPVLDEPGWHAFAVRDRLAAAGRLAGAAGRATAPLRLVAQLAGIPVAGDRHQHQADLAGLTFYRILAHADTGTAGPSDRIGAPDDADAEADGLATGATDLRGLLDEVCRLRHGEAGWAASPRAALALALGLARAGWCRRPIASLARLPADPTAGPDPIATLLVTEIAGLRQRFQRFTTTWQAWSRRFASERGIAADGSGRDRLAGALAWLATLGAVSPAELAAPARLSCTRVQAGRLLGELERIGLAREITGRKSWRLYVAPDIEAGDAAPISLRQPAPTALAAAHASASANAAPPDHLVLAEQAEAPPWPRPAVERPLPLDIDLEPSLRELAAAEARVKRLLGEIGKPRSTGPDALPTDASMGVPAEPPGRPAGARR